MNDPIGQLKVAASAVSSENRGYLYDAAWNLARRTNGPSAVFSVDSKNQLTSVGSNTYGSDANGNLTSEVIPSVGTNYYTYDDENRLVGVQSTPRAG